MKKILNVIFVLILSNFLSVNYFAVAQVDCALVLKENCPVVNDGFLLDCLQEDGTHGHCHWCSASEECVCGPCPYAAPTATPRATATPPANDGCSPFNNTSESYCKVHYCTLPGNSSRCMWNSTLKKCYCP